MSMETNNFLEEMEFTDKVQDAWTHRRTRLFFMDIIEQTSSYVILKPKCPICGKTWKERKFYYDLEGEYNWKVQAWISSIMARHFKKEHGFSMIRIQEGSGYFRICNVYKCPICEKEIHGLMHALAHWVSHKKVIR
jgi:hypothetical protein